MQHLVGFLARGRVTDVLVVEPLFDHAGVDLVECERVEGSEASVELTLVFPAGLGGEVSVLHEVGGVVLEGHPVAFDGRGGLPPSLDNLRLFQRQPGLGVALALEGRGGCQPGRPALALVGRVGVASAVVARRKPVHQSPGTRRLGRGCLGVGHPRLPLLAGTQGSDVLRQRLGTGFFRGHRTSGCGALWADRIRVPSGLGPWYVRGTQTTNQGQIVRSCVSSCKRIRPSRRA